MKALEDEWYVVIFKNGTLINKFTVFLKDLLIIKLLHTIM